VVPVALAKGTNKIMYYVYLLKLKNKYIYTGSTPDLKRRIAQHQKGNAKQQKILFQLT
jgi:predicted GIY-YIG superfamily endonuclease